MAVRSPPRLDWAPGDAGLVSYRERSVALHDATGRYQRELAHERIYDVRWCDDGRIVALDDRGSVTFDARGAITAQTNYWLGSRAPHAASLAASGDRCVVLAQDAIHAFELGATPQQLWTFHAASYGARIIAMNARSVSALAAVEISPDGRLVAIGYPSLVQGTSVHGWIVIELASDQFLQRARAPLTARPTKPPLFAFDADGRRLALVSDRLDPSWGVVRIDGEGGEVPDAFARHVPGGAHAVALDRGGLLAAYAYPETPPGARGRLRVDYLSPAETGPVSVEVIDTLSLDPALPDLVALAFSRDSRTLACLASTGAIEIVPVP